MSCFRLRCQCWWVVEVSDGYKLNVLRTVALNLFRVFRKFGVLGPVSCAHQKQLRQNHPSPSGQQLTATIASLTGSSWPTRRTDGVILKISCVSAVRWQLSRPRRLLCQVRVIYNQEWYIKTCVVAALMLFGQQSGVCYCGDLLDGPIQHYAIIKAATKREFGTFLLPSVCVVACNFTRDSVECFS